MRGGVGVYTVAVHHRRHLQPGFSQSTPLVADAGQRADVPGDAGATRSRTACCSRSGNALGAEHVPRRRTSSRFAPLDFKNAQNMRYIGQRAARAAGPVAARSRLRRQPRLRPARPTQELERRSPRSTSRPAPCATRRRSTSSARRSPIRSSGLLPDRLQRRDRRALAAAAAVPAVRQRADRSTTTARAEYNSAQFEAREALHARATTRARQPTRGRSFTERVFKLNATDTDLREAAVARSTCRTASTLERHLGAAVRQRDGAGRADASGVRQRADRRLERQRDRAVPERPAASTSTAQHLLQRRSRRVEGELHATNTDVPVFDISGFYFHDAAVQTNGVDDPAKQRADSRIRLANNVRYFPSRIDGHPQPVPEPVGHLDRQAGAAQRPRPRAVQRRVPERVQPCRSSTTRTPIRPTPTSAR